MTTADDLPPIEEIRDLARRSGLRRLVGPDTQDGWHGDSFMLRKFALAARADREEEIVVLTSERDHLQAQIDGDVYRKESEAVRVEFGWKRDPRGLVECIAEQDEKLKEATEYAQSTDKANFHLKRRALTAEARVRELGKENEQLVARLTCMCGSWADQHSSQDGHHAVPMYDYALDKMTEERDALRTRLEALTDADSARNFPTGTCSASRHAQIIANQMVDGSYRTDADMEHQGQSILATVKCLWEARARLEAIEKQPTRGIRANDGPGFSELIDRPNMDRNADSPTATAEGQRAGEGEVGPPR